MQYELEARTRQGMEEQIAKLEAQFNAIHSDLAKCARGISPCYFCENDKNCNGLPEKCNFVWEHHN